MTAALLLARFALAIVFFVAGVAKLLDPTGSRTALSGFGLPKSLAGPFGVALPIVEIIVAIALIPAASARWGAVGAVVLLGVFVAGIASVMIRGREAECHCFGQLHSSRVGWPTLARNLALALVAGFVIVRESGGGSRSYVEWISGMSRVELLVLSAGAIVLVALTAGGWFMMNLLRQHGRILVRLDALEAGLAENGILLDPSTRGSAHGLTPGVGAPVFALPNLRGGTTTLDDLLAPRLPLLLLFGHPGCPPCVAMLPEVGSWQSGHSTDLTIALISQGSPDDNRAVVAGHGIERVLLQQDREISDTYEAYGTPSAVLVSSEGLIASPVAQGAQAIRVLIDSAVTPALSDVNGNTNESANRNSESQLWLSGAESSMSGIGLNAN